MSKKKTQKTPKGHEIPVPTKEEFERNLKKVAKPAEIRIAIIGKATCSMLNLSY